MKTTHRQSIRRPIPILGNRKPHVFFQIINDDLGTIALVAVLVQLEPSNLLSIRAEDGTMNGSLLA